MEAVGVDIAKRELVAAWGGKTEIVSNEKAAIERFLAKLPREAEIGVEATGGLQELLAETAQAKGLRVYQLNPKDVKRYREAVRDRGKTDLKDAELIARYVAKEHEHLRLYKALPKELRRLEQLIWSREQVVGVRVQLNQALRGVDSLTEELERTLKRLGEHILRLEQEMEELAKRYPAYHRLRQIPGVGKLTAAALVVVLAKGEFRRADSLVAYVGLDLKANDSGEKKGRRRLSKQGDARVRRLLFCAALAGMQTVAWRGYYERMLEHGMSAIQAMVSLSRKILRTAWSMNRYETTFSLERLAKPLT